MGVEFDQDERDYNELSEILKKEDMLARIKAIVCADLKYGARARAEIFEEGITLGDDLSPRTRFRLAVSKVKKLVGQRRLSGYQASAEDKQVLVLMVQHWLEATDENHRYGGHLLPYYNVWKESDTTESFFKWLDDGEGRTVDLEKCSRYVLGTEHVKYCTIIERERYVVMPNSEGKLHFVQSGDVVNGEMIFVMGPKGILFMGTKERGRFHHSSFLGGGAVLVAGSAIVTDGIFTNISPHSGHYRPVRLDFLAFIDNLEQQGLDKDNLAWIQTKVDDVEFGDKTKGK
eukprot:GEMP01038237.1.p1 GENE.GEMP01038237.1~~GEMP01038237.1.p1  ORF type:complete len:288 (+),score=66.98 GEMP01038237.1:148-1011(+)